MGLMRLRLLYVEVKEWKQHAFRKYCYQYFIKWTWVHFVSLLKIHKWKLLVHTEASHMSVQLILNVRIFISKYNEQFNRMFHVPAVVLAVILCKMNSKKEINFSTKSRSMCVCVFSGSIFSSFFALSGTISFYPRQSPSSQGLLRHGEGSTFSQG